MIGFYDYTVIATYGALFIALHGIYMLPPQETRPQVFSVSYAAAS